MWMEEREPGHMNDWISRKLREKVAVNFTNLRKAKCLIILKAGNFIHSSNDK